MAAVLIPACGTNASLNSLLTPDMRQQVQKAAGASGAMDQSNQAVQDALVDSGNPGTTTSTSSPIAISYVSSLDLTVDLAAVHGGRSRYPGASGLLSVVASGSSRPIHGEGSVAYQAAVTAVTELRFSDALSGTTIQMAQGTQWTLAVRIRWEFIDADHWSITAESSESWSGFDFSGTRQEESFNGTLVGSRNRSVSYVQQSGAVRVTPDRSGDLTVRWDDSIGTHEVGIQATGLDAILVSVSGTTFGPMTRAQVTAVFRVRRI